MKKIILILILLLPGIIYSQYHNEIRPVTKGVVEIEQIYFNGVFKKSGWKTLYEYFDDRVIRQRNWYKGDLRLDETHNYTKNGNEVIKETINKNNEKFVVIDSISNQLMKRKIYLDYDSITPPTVLHSYSYDSENNLISYKWTFKNFDGRETTNCSKFKYLKNKIVIQELDNCEKIKKTITLELDKKGNSVFETIDHHDINTVITGGRSENGVQRYMYRYDERGNWVKRYYVTSKGKSILEIKRKIKYK